MTDHGPLTVSDLTSLSIIAQAAERSARVRWLLDEGEVAEGVARAITHDDGGFLSSGDDVRDAYLWVSGVTERWLPVSSLVNGVRMGIVSFDL